ncbi:MAG: tetratricopeptide repeat protein [Crocinitomicaceae bacterium]|nr:tetratricopeptide repeat protein [Crocinitomicaceae bacterium]
MKVHSLLTLALCFFALTSIAQKKELAEAKAHFESREYIKAETAINAALEKKKGKTDKEVWAFRGDIYSKIATDEIGTSATRNAFESYVQAESLGTDGEYNDQLISLSRSCFGVGYDYHRAGKYDQAIEMHQLLDTILVKLDPSDGQAKIVIAQSYFIQEKYDKAIETYQSCIASGQNLKEAYEGIDRTYQMSYEYTPEMRVANIKDALAKLPNNEGILSIASNVYSSARDFKKAEDICNKMIQNYPESPNSYFAMGNVMFDAYSISKQNEDEEGIEKHFEKAVKSYEKSNELAPNTLVIEHSLGNLYFQRALQYQKEKNDLGFSSEDMEKHEELTTKNHDHLKKALPYLRSAFDKSETFDQILFSTLKSIYITLEMNEEYKELNDMR